MIRITHRKQCTYIMKNEIMTFYDVYDVMSLIIFVANDVIRLIVFVTYDVCLHMIFVAYDVCRIIIFVAYKVYLIMTFVEYYVFSRVAYDVCRNAQLTSTVDLSLPRIGVVHTNQRIYMYK